MVFGDFMSMVSRGDGAGAARLVDFLNQVHWDKAQRKSSLAFFQKLQFLSTQQAGNPSPLHISSSINFLWHPFPPFVSPCVWSRFADQANCWLGFSITFPLVVPACLPCPPILRAPLRALGIDFLPQPHHLPPESDNSLALYPYIFKKTTCSMKWMKVNSTQFLQEKTVIIMVVVSLSLGVIT